MQTDFEFIFQVPLNRFYVFRIWTFQSIHADPHCRFYFCLKGPRIMKINWLAWAQFDFQLTTEHIQCISFHDVKKFNRFIWTDFGKLVDNSVSHPIENIDWFFEDLQTKGWLQDSPTIFPLLAFFDNENTKPRKFGTIKQNLWKYFHGTWDFTSTLQNSIVKESREKAMFGGLIDMSWTSQNYLHSKMIEILNVIAVLWTKIERKRICEAHLNIIWIANHHF